MAETPANYYTRHPVVRVGTLSKAFGLPMPDTTWKDQPLTRERILELIESFTTMRDYGTSEPSYQECADLVKALNVVKTLHERGLVIFT